jgi:recombination protein RecT
VGELVPTRPQNVNEVIRLLNSETMETQIAKALPKHLGAERFTRLAITMIRRPDLGKCKPMSIVSAVMEAAQVGLELDGVLGHGYLVPYKTECKFIPGYRGLITMASRCPGVSHVEAAVVYEGDEFSYQKGDNPILQHTPTRDTSKRGDATAYYAVLVFQNGQRKWEVMEKADVNKVRDRSPASKSSYSPWSHPEDVHEMGKKTVIKRVLKTAGLTAEITKYVAQEEYYEAGVGTKHVESEVVEPTRGTKALTARLTDEPPHEPDEPGLPSDEEILEAERRAEREG